MELDRPAAQRAGMLMRQKREAVTPKMNQEDLGRALGGIPQTTISAYETGTTATIPADVVNRLPGIIGLTVPELLRAMGYELPKERISSWLPDDLLGVLETADAGEKAAIQSQLRGLLAERLTRLAPPAKAPRPKRTRRPRPPQPSSPS